MFTEQDIIFKYTRADAIQDGILIDVSDIAKEAGFKCQVAISQRLHNRINHEFNGQTYKGRLWDVLWMAANACRKSRGSGYLDFTVLLGLPMEVKPRVIQLTLHYGAGDDENGVATIGFAEDF